jgi:hypothetical protein
MRNLDRSERFFGKDGLGKLRATSIVIVGEGGLGTHVTQQTALHGVRDFGLIDDQMFQDTDQNRYVGVRYDDIGTAKVVLGERLIKSVDPEANVTKIHKELASAEAFAAIKKADVVFGCLDNEGARLILTELCSAYGKPLFDLASDIEVDGHVRYGGRIIAAFTGNGCPVCLGELDLDAAREDLSTPELRQQRDALYGIKKADLRGSGPAVVSINGVVASLGVNEFMVYVTGLRAPRALLTYRGDLGGVLVRKEPAPPDCYYCHGIWNQRERVGVERYLD